MKRIIIAVVLLLGLGLSGYQYAGYNSNAALLSKTEEQLTNVNTQITQYSDALSALPISQYQNNSEMVKDVISNKQFKLISITAQSKDEFGAYNNIVTVDNVDDVAYFTNTVSRIMITVSYKNFDKAYKAVSELKVPYSSVQFDYVHNTVSIFITPVTIGDSEITSEMTALDSEATETTEGTTKSDSESVDDALSNAEPATEFDIKYLGGDSDE